MNETDLIAVSLDDTFQFACHNRVTCFNHCCKDLNQALSPYDVLQLRAHLDLSWEDFLRHFADVYSGPSTGLPVVSLRFYDSAEQRCPFVTDQGCRVYDARPTSCRLYPLARALRRERADGRVSVHYALFREPHCRGFEQSQNQTVRQWLAAQKVDEGLAANDALMELIALKNSCLSGPLSATHRDWAKMALYDLDALKSGVTSRVLPIPEGSNAIPPPDGQDDAAWLTWGLAWIQRVLRLG